MPLEFDSPMLDAPLVTPHGETQPDPNPNKRHAVSGPGRNQFENTKAAEDFHKEQAMLARQAVKTKQQEIVQLRVALNAAESEARVRQQAVAELQNKCEQMAHHLQQNQAHETAIEDQLMQYQSEIVAWASASDPSVRPEHRSYTEMSKQLHDSQKLLTEQNSRMDRLQVAMTDQNYQVERLQRSLVERTDEAIHLRAQVHIGSTPRPRAARRGRQMNMTAVMDFPPTTLEIPLDPAPLPPTSSATPSTGSSGGTSAGDPTIQTMMKMLSELQTQVNSLTVKTKKSRRSAAKTVERWRCARRSVRFEFTETKQKPAVCGDPSRSQHRLNANGLASTTRASTERRRYSVGDTMVVVGSKSKNSQEHGDCALYLIATFSSLPPTTPVVSSTMLPPAHALVSTPITLLFAHISPTAPDRAWSEDFVWCWFWALPSPLASALRSQPTQAQWSRPTRLGSGFSPVILGEFSEFFEVFLSWWIRLLYPILPARFGPNPNHSINIPSLWKKGFVRWWTEVGVKVVPADVEACRKMGMSGEYELNYAPNNQLT
ncbi:hypothetical protein B0H10DRAFT_2198169 [Mycena sp. CBHHK59/15]|nr:hypothetical protein B0H10DRAFT_2198169 [Mycena sp. CBHHK59/15]